MFENQTVLFLNKYSVFFQVVGSEKFPHPSRPKLLFSLGPDLTQGSLEICLGFLPTDPIQPKKNSAGLLMILHW